MSGVRHWLEYIDIVKGNGESAFPPDLNDVIGWANTFRCLGTFGNYLTFLRTACLTWGYVPPPVGHPAISRAMNAIGKRQLFVARCDLCHLACVPFALLVAQ